jgi:UPF0271 protein
MSSSRILDLNSDMGESYGAWKMGNDEAVMDHVSSINVACGFHGGDPSVMRQTVAAALARGVAIGAHPGLPDLVGFGRRAMQITPREAYDMTVYQVGALAGVAASQGARLSHVKAHGMLYNMAVKDRELARALCRAVRDVDSDLIFYGLAGSILIEEAEAAGLRAAHEVFGDRAYQPDGTLTPRAHPGAMITDLKLSIEQVLGMARDGVVRAIDGTLVPVKADTLCIHGDQPGAPVFAQALRAALNGAGIEVRALGA